MNLAGLSSIEGVIVVRRFRCMSSRLYHTGVDSAASLRTSWEVERLEMRVNPRNRFGQERDLSTTGSEAEMPTVKRIPDSRVLTAWMNLSFLENTLPSEITAPESS
jgi:hypothetical protein